MANPVEANAVLSGDEIRPYRIRVSSKYLDLTKQKLELTRLPHETPEHKSRDWWEPKSQIETLIDFWLEKYDWRDQEKVLNAQLPQFRTSVPVSVPPGSETSPVRLHFIHVRSPHPHAVPLLLIPPFPFTNLSLGHLIQPLTQPEENRQQQPFHLAIPSLPGLGFSDALPSNTPAIPATAEVLNTVMARLSYTSYLVSNASAAASSPAGIDWKLVTHIAAHYSSSCLGAHFIGPALAAPTLKESPLEWLKWSIAKLFRASILGYEKRDFTSLDLDRDQERERAAQNSKRPHVGGFPTHTLEPNTPSFALCDSPVGSLALVLKILRVLGARKNFSPAEIISFTQTAWLPGPEYAMRFYANCLAHEEEKRAPRPTTKPRIAVTVFTGVEDDSNNGGDSGGGGGSGDGGNANARAPPDNIESQQAVSPRPNRTPYACPAWANASYTIVRARRIPGTPGLVAWDCPEHIVEGARDLAARILSFDGRLRSQETVADATAPLHSVVVVQTGGGGTAPITNQGAVVVGSPGQGLSPSGAVVGSTPSTPQAEPSWRLKRIREASETPSKSQQDDGGGDGGGGGADFYGQASPDTIVVTPPSN